MKRWRRRPPFVMLERATLDSQEWKKLSHSEMITYIYIKKNYNGSNNGGIPMPYSELDDIFAHGTISKALKGLVKKEWVQKKDYGGLYRHFSLYRLTGLHDKIK